MLLFAVAFEARALSLGRATSMPVLGQPLNLSVALGLDGGEELSPQCVSADVYFGDNRQPAPAVRAGLEANAIRVVTNTLVDEPVVTVYVVAGCNARITRKFVAFADPPATGNTMQRTPSASAEPAAVASVAPASAVAPGTGAVASRPKVSPRRRAPAASTAAASAQRPGASVREASRPKRVPIGPRLQLDPVDSSALAAAREASPAASAAEAALAQSTRQLQAAQEELARSREQLQKLQEQLAGASRDAAATRTLVRDLESRLRQSERERQANRLLYGLAGLCGVLLLLLGLAVWKLRRQQQEAATAWAAQHAREEAEMAATLRPDPQEPPGTTPYAAAPKGFATPVETKPEPLLDDVRPRPALSAQDTEPMPAEEPRREVSVEELIDLEQQVEFFIVLGQDEAAIDLLVSHVRSTAGGSPLPFLKLMEIYRRRGERSEYEQVRERFNSRFNAYAPSWDEDLRNGHSLEEYPSVIGRLEKLWPQPALALEVLQASLLRQDENARTFELSAYRELLFLYSVARDLAERARAAGGVDLLLPLGDGDDATSFALTSLQPLVATLERSTTVAAVDVDLDVGPPAASHPQAVRQSGFIEFERLNLTVPPSRREG